MRLRRDLCPGPSEFKPHRERQATEASPKDRFRDNMSAAGAFCRSCLVIPSALSTLFLDLALGVAQSPGEGLGGYGQSISLWTDDDGEPAGLKSLWQGQLPLEALEMIELHAELPRVRPPKAL